MFLFYSLDASVAELHAQVCEKALKPEVWSDIPLKNCTKQGDTITCFGGIVNLPIMKKTKLEGCHELNITCYLNDTFNPSETLKFVPNLKRFTIEHSYITHISIDFPRMGIEVSSYSI